MMHARRALLVTLILGTALTLVPSFLFAQTMYVSRDEVKLTEDKSPTSKVVETLRRGAQVRVIEKSDRHFKVQAPSGKSGWVFKFTLSDQKVGGGSGDLLSVVTGDTRIAAREAGTGGSIRGLKETSERYATTKHVDQAAKEAVQRMEERVIPRDELLKFQREGSVGEFSGEAP